MEWPIYLFFVILIVCILLITVTLVSLPKLGDERKNLIKMKAQSSTFAAIIGYMLIEVAVTIYKIYRANDTYRGVNPFIFLIVFSGFYLISLLYFKRKYGG